MTLLRRGVLALLAALVVALGLAAVGCQPAQPSSGIDWKIEVSGAVDQPVTITYDDLARMKQVKLSNIVMRKSRGEDQNTNWEGAAFSEVLAKAKPKANATGVTVMAADGYAIQIPMADLEKAIVALKGEDKRIADDGQGAVRVIVPDKPANFWILGLQKIKVEDQPIAAPTPKPEASPTAKP